MSDDLFGVGEMGRERRDLTMKGVEVLITRDGEGGMGRERFVVGRSCERRVVDQRAEEGGKEEVNAPQM